MKTVKQFIGHAGAKLALIFLAVLVTVQARAAEQGLEVDVNTNGGGGGAWYTSWWVWAAAALFIIALVAIISAGRRHT